MDEAFRKSSAERYDIVISEYELPQKNGLELLKKLREQNNEIPFILFTGKGQEEVAITALNLGADGYYNKNGSPETVYGELYHGIKMAVTRKATEAALVDAQTLTSFIFNSIEDMIWSVSVDNFRLLTFNETVRDYFFRTQKLTLKAGMTTKEIMPNEQLANRWIELNKRALREGSFTIEYTTLKEPRVLELTFNPLKRGEEVFGIAVFGKDITERKKTEEALLAAGEKFRTIFENVHDVITYVDTHGKILDVNDRVEELLGYKREEIVGKNFVNLGLIKLGDVPKLLKLFFGSIRKGDEKRIVELELKHKNGRSVSVEVGTRFIRDKKGKVVGVVNIFRDITANKKADEALIMSEEKFRQAFAISPDAFLISTLGESIIVDINESFLKMFGFTRPEVLEKSALELGLWANPSDRKKVARQLTTEGKVNNFEIFCKRKNGETFPILLSVSLVQANNERFALSSVRDSLKLQEN